MESCFGKSVMSGVMGFGMGGLFGMFMASVRYPLPLALLNPHGGKQGRHGFTRPSPLDSF